MSSRQFESIGEILRRGPTIEETAAPLGELAAASVVKRPSPLDMPAHRAQPQTDHPPTTENSTTSAVPPDSDKPVDTTTRPATEATRQTRAEKMHAETKKAARAETIARQAGAAAVRATPSVRRRNQYGSGQGLLPTAKRRPIRRAPAPKVPTVDDTLTTAYRNTKARREAGWAASKVATEAPDADSTGQPTTKPSVAPTPPVDRELMRSLEASQSVVDTLLEQALEGNRAALDMMLGELRTMILRYCRGRLGRQETVIGSADDVAQEVCMAVVGALPTYKIQGLSFRAFVYGIASHKVTDAFRAIGRNRMEPVAELPDSPATGDGPEARLLALEQSERLNILLARLSSRQREVLTLRIAGGLSAEEVAFIIGSTPGAVRVTQHRALNRLKKVMAEHPDNPDAREEDNAKTDEPHDEAGEPKPETRTTSGRNRTPREPRNSSP